MVWTTCLAVTVLSLICFGVGIFLFLRPAAAIEVQRRFYEKINWRIEPVSMEKELRNTRLMGMFLVAVSAAAFVYTLQTPEPVFCHV